MRSRTRSIPLTNGFGSMRPKNMRIRIRNTGYDVGINRTPVFVLCVASKFKEETEDCVPAFVLI